MSGNRIYLRSLHLDFVPHHLAFALSLSTKNHPVDILVFAELRWLLDVPDPVMPTKEELERKYKRQARYEREKERRCL